MAVAAEAEEQESGAEEEGAGEELSLLPGFEDSDLTDMME